LVVHIYSPFATCYTFIISWVST